MPLLFRFFAALLGSSSSESLYLRATSASSTTQPVEDEKGAGGGRFFDGTAFRGSVPFFMPLALSFCVSILSMPLPLPPFTELLVLGTGDLDGFAVT
uniref:Putative secreted peptide n=1 Tax=Anopheles braziliensis TaxID=58242 RepID=A0A2M3ZWF6_9DIPT